MRGKHAHVRILSVLRTQLVADYVILQKAVFTVLLATMCLYSAQCGSDIRYHYRAYKLCRFCCDGDEVAGSFRDVRDVIVSFSSLYWFATCSVGIRAFRTCADLPRRYARQVLARDEVRARSLIRKQHDKKRLLHSGG